ncbi:hypothetical protein [Pedobacter agri]|uniref:hypothetical protein n=1 Tax=Pedobacter agri TaxID=454586 RepID=UPI0029318F7C|nr:hypothetical protein [Pedobacter agri]
MIKIHNDQDYKKVIERLKQLSENSVNHSIVPEINNLTEMAIKYEYWRYDLTTMDQNNQKLSATG